MNGDRVVAVTGSHGPGSGYLVGPRLVLTSGHVGLAEGRAVTVFRPGRPGEFTGTLVWRGTPGGRGDAALRPRLDPDPTGRRPIKTAGGLINTTTGSTASRIRPRAGAPGTFGRRHRA